MNSSVSSSEDKNKKNKKLIGERKHSKSFGQTPLNPTFPQ
jgi:hypothetical protein